MLKYFGVFLTLFLWTSFAGRAGADESLGYSYQDQVKQNLIHNSKGDQTFSRALASYAMGVIFDNEGNQEKALEFFEKARQLEKHSAHPALRVGADQYLLGRTAEAVATLEGVLVDYPEDLRVRFLLATIYSHQKKFDLAAEQYREVIKINSSDLKALSSLADLFIFQQKFEEAANVYEKIIETGEPQAVTYFNLGMLYTRLKRIDRAIEVFGRAAKLKPNYQEAYVAIGVLNESKGGYKEAYAAYKKALKNDPSNLLINKRLAESAARARMDKEAQATYMKLIKLQSTVAEHYLGLTAHYANIGDYEGILVILRKALANCGERFEIFLGLGYAYHQRENYPLAIDNYRKALSLKPDYSRAHFYLANSLERTGKREEAYQHLHKAIDINKNFADALNYAGYMYAQDNKNLVEAEVFVKRALEIDPDNGAYLDSLGWIYNRQGHFDEALNYLKAAYKALPGDSEVAGHLVEVYINLGRSEEAQKMLDAIPAGTSGRGKLLEKLDASRKKTPAK